LLYHGFANLLVLPGFNGEPASLRALNEFFRVGTFEQLYGDVYFLHGFSSMMSGPFSEYV
jgi:hypothetical protein